MDKFKTFQRIGERKSELLESTLNTNINEHKQKPILVPKITKQ